MRRLVALIAMALLAGCTTVDDLAPISLCDLRTDEHQRQDNRRGRVPALRRQRSASVGRRAPWSYPVHGTDVSKYQTSVGWSDAKAAGISFAFVKATEGGDRVDDNFAENWQRAKAAGVPRSAYHFFYFCRPAEEQARWFIRHVPRDRSALPPVLDMEWNPQLADLQAQARRRDGAQRNARLPDDGGAPLRQEADHLHARSTSSRTTTCRHSAAIHTGCVRSPVIRTRNIAAIPSPSGSTPAPASSLALQAKPTSTSSTAASRPGKSG